MVIGFKEYKLYSLKFTITLFGFLSPSSNRLPSQLFIMRNLTVKKCICFKIIIIFSHRELRFHMCNTFEVCA